jgi:2'-5' RNA ligase
VAAQSAGPPRQLSLDFGTPTPGRPIHRPETLHQDALFFAVLPPPAAALRIAEQAERLRRQYGLRATRPTERLHVSLASVGIFRSGLPDAAVSTAIAAGSRVRGLPFEVTLDRVSTFNGGDRRPLVLLCSQGFAELVALGRALTSSLCRLGLASRAAFTPHVTLLYDRRIVPDTHLDEPITCTVRDFVLVHSLQGLGRHVHRACWPLRG